MKKHEVGNFRFEIKKVKGFRENLHTLTIFFKNKQVDQMNIGWIFNKKTIQVAASETDLLVKVYKQYEINMGDMPPIAGVLDETSYIINTYSVATGEKLSGKEFRADKNKLLDGENYFKQFNQPSLEL